MSENQMFQLVSEFMVNKPSVELALQELKFGKSIDVSIEDREIGHVFLSDTGVQFADGPGSQSDVLFVVNSESIRRLTETPCETLSETGIEICREVLAGNMKIRLIGKPQDILFGGYLNIIKKAGPEFLNFLAEHGMKNMFKIMSFIKSMKG
jgi:hypothetical protein